MLPYLKMRRIRRPASRISALFSHELIAALKKAQAEEILVKGHNSFAVDPETFDCDYYRFLQGDPAAVNAFQNDYMQSYSWAENPEC